MRRLVIPSFALCLLAGACTTWEPEPGPAPEVILANHSTTVRILRKSGSRIIIRDPEVVADSIVGKAGSTSERLAVAVSDVQSIDAERTNAVGTTLLTASLVLGAAIVYLIVQAGNAVGELP